MKEGGRMNSIGKRIKYYRKKAGLTQIKLASLVNMSRSHIASIETDAYNPSLDALNSIAEALNIDSRLLLGDDSSDNNKLNEKDKKEIERDLEKIMADFKDNSSGPMFYDGIELDDDDIDKLELAMRVALETAKKKNKEKYTPKKYKEKYKDE